MNSKKLTPIVAATGAALAMLFTPGTPATAQTTTTAAAQTTVSASSTTATSAGARAVKRSSIKCIAPRGKKSNYSWGNGDTSTTVYFNNHCSHRVYAKLHFTSFSGSFTRCLATNGGTSGKKKFGHGAIWNLKKITNDC